LNHFAAPTLRLWARGVRASHDALPDVYFDRLNDDENHAAAGDGNAIATAAKMRFKKNARKPAFCFNVPPGAKQASIT
jgi:hypothetical protein